jgi:hypothetical protein
MPDHDVQSRRIRQLPVISFDDRRDATMIVVIERLSAQKINRLSTIFLPRRVRRRPMRGTGLHPSGGARRGRRALYSAGFPTILRSSRRV